MSQDDVRKHTSAAVTAMIRAWGRGEAVADEAGVLLYAELHRRARAHLRRERQNGTLSPTDLIHDAFLRLLPQRVQWANRDQFYAASSRMMRRALVDHARVRHAKKRAAVRVELTEDLVAGAPPRALDVLAVDQALTMLEALDERQARLVELRFFGGLTQEEAASALSVSLATANRDWRFARAWLIRQLGLHNSAR